jgi:CubicO group peptidase (beta-lactamase class C family)
LTSASWNESRPPRPSRWCPSGIPAVLIEKNGQVVFSRAYGLADRQRGIPNTPHTRFRVGSMNKMFTGVAVLQLVAAGKVEHRLELRALDDYVRLDDDREPEFEPGSRWRYSNYGYILLGAVVEQVTVQTYYDYVQERIYEPARMNATGSQPEDQPVQDLSAGYMKQPGTAGRVPNTGTLPYRGTSAGGVLDSQRPYAVLPGAAGPPTAQRRLHAAADHRTGGRCAWP